MSIEVKSEHTAGEGLEAELQYELEKFDAFFQSVGNEPLSRPETAILKTYLVYKVTRENER